MSNELVPTVVDRALGAAKAIVALVTPVVTLLVTEVLADLSAWAERGIAGLATGAVVYLVKNQQVGD